MSTPSLADQLRTRASSTAMTSPGGAVLMLRAADRLDAQAPIIEAARQWAMAEVAYEAAPHMDNKVALTDARLALLDTFGALASPEEQQ